MTFDFTNKYLKFNFKLRCLYNKLNFRKKLKFIKKIKIINNKQLNKLHLKLNKN